MATNDQLAQRLGILEGTVNNVLGQVNQLGGDLTVIKNTVNSFANYVEGEKTKFGALVLWNTKQQSKQRSLSANQRSQEQKTTYNNFTETTPSCSKKPKCTLTN